MTTVHPELVETLQLRRVGNMTIIGIAGDERAETYSGAGFDFGGATYSPRRVVVLPSSSIWSWSGVMGFRLGSTMPA